MNPEQLKYSKTHEWVSVEGDIATIGITDFAVHLLSDLVFAELPAAGRKIVQGQPFGEVESVKAVSDLYAPVSGEIIAVNDRLHEHKGPDGKTVAAELDLLTSSPFSDGWMVKAKVSNPDELSTLMTAAQYKTHCETSQH